MGFFGRKKDKEKKGLFGWRKRKEEAELSEEESLIDASDSTETALEEIDSTDSVDVAEVVDDAVEDAEESVNTEETETEDIAAQLLAEREAAKQAEAERWREQAEAEAAAEQAEAAALAAKAAREELLPDDEDDEDDEDEEEVDEEMPLLKGEGDHRETVVESDTSGSEAEDLNEENHREAVVESDTSGSEAEDLNEEDHHEAVVESNTSDSEAEEEMPPLKGEGDRREAVVGLNASDSEAEEENPSVTYGDSSPFRGAKEGNSSVAEDDSAPFGEAEEEPKKKKGFFEKIRDGLRKTKDSVIAKMQSVLNAFTKIDEDLFDQLEETMIMGDMGAETSIEICDQLRKRVKEQGITDPKQIMGLIQEIIGEMLGEDQPLHLETKPSVIMVIGVNGAGKTTTIGKLCHQLKADGKRVIVAAADTFRAAAIDQLEVWTERSGVELVKHAEGSDPASVVYDAIDAAKARDCDVLICDTAGRLHNKKNLMQELEKMNRILEKKTAGCDREVLLVLDATTGQNAVNQARLFQEVADITGIVLTKLDGTAKGGIVVSIKNELQIPVKLIGVGEKIDDLQPFHATEFVNALFEKEES